MKPIQAYAVVLSAVFILFAGGNAFAEGPDAAMHQGACKADAEKLCPGVQPGQGAIRDCLKQHEAELSAGCKSNITVMKEKMHERKEEIQAACKADLDQYCKDVTPGEGRPMACLHAYNDKISAGCKEAMMKRHPKKSHKGSPAGTMEKK